MSLVLKAKHHQTGRIVALKILSHPAAKSNEVVERLQRECEIGQQLDHPNVLEIFQVTHHEGCHYVVMEYLEGETFADMVKRGGPMDVKLAV